MKETIEVEGERDLQINRIRILDKRLKSLEQQIHDMLEVQIKNTQVLHLCSCKFWIYIYVNAGFLGVCGWSSIII